MSQCGGMAKTLKATTARSSRSTIVAARKVKGSLFKETLKKIVQQLNMKQGQAALTLQILEDDTLSPGDGGGKATHWVGFSRCSQIPKCWLASVLMKLNRTLTKALLEQIDVADLVLGIRNICEIACAVNFKSWGLPEVALRKAVAGRVLQRRAGFLGNRLSDVWVGKAIGADHKVDFCRFGVYTLCDAAGGPVDLCALPPAEAKSIRHVSGALKDVPEMYAVSSDWALTDSHSDVNAKIWKGSAKIFPGKDS